MKPRRGVSVTIQDVAREAGVGLGTVSRVLNNHPSVSEAARKSVLEAVERLNYQPNAQARRLVKGKAETVCFVLSNREFIDPFHALVLHGAQKHFATVDEQLIYLPFDYPETTDSESLVLPNILSARGVVDGAILAGTTRRNLLLALDRVGVPYVVFGNNLLPEDENVPDSVWFDDTDGGRQVGAHLLDEGRTRIWYIGDISLPWFRRRWQGCSEVLQGRGTELRLVEAGSENDSIQYGYQAARQLIGSGDAFDAVFAGNDAIAYGVWKAFDEHGIRIPDDAAIVGFDDREFCSLTSPNLSSVQTFNERVGRECARVLLEKLKDPNRRIPQVKLPTALVVRGSSARGLD